MRGRIRFFVVLKNVIDREQLQEKVIPPHREITVEDRER